MNEVKNNNLNTKERRDVASLDDIYLNFFDSNSYDIVSNIKQAKDYPEIPKIYIEDP